MQAEAVSPIYARALLEAADAKGIIDDVADEAEGLRECLAKDPDIRVFLENPRVEKSLKRGLLAKGFEGKVSETFLHFLYVVVQKGRALQLNEILGCFLEERDRKLGILRAEVVTAVELDASTLESIRERMEKRLEKTVVMEPGIDAEILGGLIVRFDGMVADCSLRSSLNELRSRMLSMKFGNELVHED